LIGDPPIDAEAERVDGDVAGRGGRDRVLAGREGRRVEADRARAACDPTDLVLDPHAAEHDRCLRELSAAAGREEHVE